MNAKKVPEDCGPQKKGKDERISPVQFLRDREIGTCDETGSHHQ